MIIDTHARNNHNSVKNSFRYLTRDEICDAIWLL